MLTVEGLSCSYGPVQALSDVSIEVPAGSLVAILGANGAGKSTLLKAVAGLVRPDTGTVTVDGTAVTSLAPDRRLKLGVALCPEGRRIFPDFTVGDNLRVGAHLLPKGQLDERVDAALALFPALRSRLSQPAGSLSGGEQQMVAIGRALMTRPRLLLLDEPSLGLAPLITHQVFEAVSGLRSQGLTVLLVEQHRGALRYADYAYVLRRGRVSMAGPAEEILGDEELRRAYLG